VREVGIGVHLPPEPWPLISVTTHALRACQLLDRDADVAQARALPDYRDPGVATAARDVDEAPRLLAGFADDERGAGVDTSDKGLSLSAR
jgi:hypothetical protein